MAVHKVYILGENITMIKKSICTGILLILGFANVIGQQTSQSFKWKELGEPKGLQALAFLALSSDDKTVTINKISGSMRSMSTELIIVNHNFETIKTIDISPKQVNKSSFPTSTSYIASSNGKSLAMVSSSGFAKGLMTVGLAYQVMDTDFAPISAPVDIKQPSGGVIPVNLIDLANPMENNPFQYKKIGNDLLITYVLSDDAESNLNIGLIRFDADFNVIFNQLHEINMPANRLIDFRLADTEIDGSYYVVIKETTSKNPQTKVAMPAAGVSL